MNYLVNSGVMSAIDNRTIHEIGIPAMVLMERAALAVANVIYNECTKDDKIVAICGTGNNGGDGICAARILHDRGFNVSVAVIGDISKCSDQTKSQLSIVHNLGLDVIYCTTESPNTLNISEYNVIIDAIFGIGLSRDIKGDYALVVDSINKSGAKVYSVDIPSGINADNGRVMNTAVKADCTITFGINKLGLVLYPGADYAGKVITASIGFPNKVIDDVLKNYNTWASYIEKDNYKSFLPSRRKDSNKGVYGRVLIVAGSHNMAGAAYLSAKAAYTAGAGLVEIFTDERNRVIIQSLLPEAILKTYEYTQETAPSYSVDSMSTYPKYLDSMNKAKAMLAESVAQADAIVIGPGLGVSSMTQAFLETIFDEAKSPVIIDADAINTLSTMVSYNMCKDVILTPHLKEMSRLIKVEVENIKKDIVNTANNYVLDNNTNKNTNIVTVLKDSKTVIASNNKTFINRSGNSGMSTGGSGDVLTGIIAAYVAAFKKNYDADSLLERVAVAVYVHGLAGDYYADQNNEYSLMAEDIIDSLRKL